jgi:hypothetical protein
VLSMHKALDSTPSVKTGDGHTVYEDATSLEILESNT